VDIHQTKHPSAFYVFLLGFHKPTIISLTDGQRMEISEIEVSIQSDYALRPTANWLYGGLTCLSSPKKRELAARIKVESG
jgi:hypothetical protein